MGGGFVGVALKTAAHRGVAHGRSFEVADYRSAFVTHQAIGQGALVHRVGNRRGRAIVRASLRPVVKHPFPIAGLPFERRPRCR